MKHLTEKPTIGTVVYLPCLSGKYLTTWTTWKDTYPQNQQLQGSSVFLNELDAIRESKLRRKQAC